ncbi:methyltransferase domain-containing protein [Cyanobacterium stanieri LEGE 03274]|uniref:Methyltransferase domain-containing protein n=1 Tax=Cyanobacterium stanieri LEGE 03274 TaxID=1828756 RepID=A0ABR9V8L5_9CHRO|nr:class I SAM-dependent methyltransferase [Cyanobacterium stanieri]MBE9223174.1 methyltransferase domain-containing protein [Cyanobacterium stanieri LEGE 03274]
MGYFDALLERFEEDKELEKAFGKHIHWGYWENPSSADGSLKDFAIASNNLSRLVIDVAQVDNGFRILDAGCGFGGTISLLNEGFDNLLLRGVNIDGVQVKRASEVIIPRGGNDIQFIEGDASNLPNFNDLFDVAIALECIFAFPSREKFFEGVKQNLKQEGKLIVVDFIINPTIIKIWSWFEKNILSRLITDTYGSKATNEVAFIDLKTYQEIAQKTGFRLEKVIDINKNVQPTYPAINSIIINNFNDFLTAKGLEYFSLLNLIQYQILIFQPIK